jgi:hypothetical protein
MRQKTLQKLEISQEISDVTYANIRDSQAALTHN